MEHFKHRLCNGTLAPAPGDEDSVDTLHVQQGKIGEAVVTRSFWRPDAQELVLLASGGCVMFSSMSLTHAPIRLDAVPDRSRTPDATVHELSSLLVDIAKQLGFDALLQRVQLGEESFGYELHIRPREF